MQFPKSIVSALLLGLIGVGSLAAQDWAQVVKTWGPAVGKIEIKIRQQTQGSGTGFIVDATGRMLTNAHVVVSAKNDPAKTIIVTFPYSADSTKEYPATIVTVVEDLDLAVLQVPIQVGNPCELDEGGTPPLMTPVLVMGFPLGKGFKATPGFLQAMQVFDGVGTMIDLSAPIDFGNSGGPVFGSNGKVIGMATAKIFGLNFNLALPIGNAVAVLAGDAGKRQVKIASNPVGSRVFVNGSYKGLTPLTVELYDREYEFMIEHDGYQGVTKSLKVPADSKITMDLTPIETKTIRVAIETTPAGAEIFVNNEGKGKSPVSFDAERGTKLRIRAQLFLRKDVYKEVVVEKDDDKLIRLVFE